jgi:hypothetical protein
MGTAIPPGVVDGFGIDATGRRDELLNRYLPVAHFKSSSTPKISALRNSARENQGENQCGDADRDNYHGSERDQPFALVSRGANDGRRCLPLGPASVCFQRDRWYTGNKQAVRYLLVKQPPAQVARGGDQRGSLVCCVFQRVFLLAGLDPQVADSFGP